MDLHLKQQSARRGRKKGETEKKSLLGQKKDKRQTKEINIYLICVVFRMRAGLRVL